MTSRRGHQQAPALLLWQTQRMAALLLLQLYDYSQRSA